MDFPPADGAWCRWVFAFVQSVLRRLVDLGCFTPARAREIGEVFKRLEATPHAWMTTPVVLEMIAVNR